MSTPLPFVTFRVDGLPQQVGSKIVFNPKPSKDTKCCPECGNPIEQPRPQMIDANKRYKQWRNAVEWAAKGAMGGRNPLEGPVKVHIDLYFPRPKGHYVANDPLRELKKTAPKFHTTTPDADKVFRNAGDGLTGIVVKDDSQISAPEPVKYYIEHGYQPHALFLIYDLSEENTL